MRQWLVLCALGLGACSVPHVVWEAPGQDAAATAAQWKIDSTECMGIATRAVALPSEPAAQAESAVQTDITANQSGSSGQTIAPGSEAETRIIRAAALKELPVERQALNDACMLNRGWVKRES